MGWGGAQQSDENPTILAQEVRRSAAAFLSMLQVLGQDWAFLVTDVTEGAAGNNERLAFVFDS